MTEQQTPPPPAERPIPVIRRHWDGNGWTQPTPTAAPGLPELGTADDALGRAAS